ncbi:hypothetical protein AURDEDRAFT_127281 [Auricularia subglabra TFB-10046 SS5]|nr:hypothetical protein AURDEDRAFT_127281 [Auricularia subglabra TFB-10046 SS5]
MPDLMDIQWVGQAQDESSWLCESDFAGQTWIINRFWDNIEGASSKEEYNEGDIVYAAQAWLEKMSRTREKEAASKANRKPPPSRPRQKSDDSDDDEAFFRGKRRLTKSQRSSPPRQAKSTPLKQQRLNFAKVRSSSKPVPTSSPIASSSRPAQTRLSQADQSAIVISSSSDDEPVEVSSRPSGSRLRRSTTSAAAAPPLDTDSERPLLDGFHNSSRQVTRSSPVSVQPSLEPLNSTSTLSRKSKAKGRVIPSSPPLSPTASRPSSPATRAPRVVSPPAEPKARKKSPSPAAPVIPAISTPSATARDVPAPNGIVDLCTPSPEPPRKAPPLRSPPPRIIPSRRVATPPRTSASSSKRANPFAAFAFDPGAEGPSRPAKKRRLDATDRPAITIPVERPAGPVSPQSFRARADFQSSRPSSSKTASVVALAKDIVSDAVDVVDLTASDEQSSSRAPGGDENTLYPRLSPSPCVDLFLPTEERPSSTAGGGDVRYPSLSPSPEPPAFVPNGLLGGFSRLLNGTSAALRHDREASAPRTPLASNHPLPGAGGGNAFSSPANPWFSPGVATLSLSHHTPLRPNGLLSSPSNPLAGRSTLEERTPLRPNGLLSSPSAIATAHGDFPPLRPNGLLGTSSSPIIEVSPTPRRTSPITKGSNEPESEEDDEEAFFRGPRRKAVPSAGPESYRKSYLPALGDDELPRPARAMPASYRSAFSLELKPDYVIPVRLRDVVAGNELEMPRCVFLQGAQFLVVPKSGDAHHALVFAAAESKNVLRALWIPDNMRIYRHCVVVALVAALDLDKLPPSDELFEFTGQ